jgi:beta-lactamase class D
VKHFILYFSAFMAFFSCSSQKKNDLRFNLFEKGNFTIHNEFKNYFDACGVDGAIVIFDKNNQQWILSDTTNVKIESLPASTFKIINLLIALETKTIKDENEVIRWVGKTDTVKYGYRPEIYHDMSVKEAFEVSAGWVFIEIAKKIGKETYKKYLTACKYGNLNLSESSDDFWNFGDFSISPIDQTVFIKNLYEEKLPFSKRSIEIVKRVMITEKTAQFTIGAKTGWTRDKGMNTGWWVGYLETSNNTYYFATRLLQNRKYNRDDFGTCRKEITKKIFRDLGFFNSLGEKMKNEHALFSNIDHVPIVVNDLEKLKDILKNQLHFAVKEGKVHAGIKNCFVKFEDGTYLEFIQPVDSSQIIGKYYANFLQTRQGGTALAVSITNTNLVKQMLTEKNIPFTYDSNKIWQTIEPALSTLFFIEYADKNWKEKPANTTHPNTATSLVATYVLTDIIAAAVKKYETLGIVEKGSGEYAGTPYKLLKAGKGSLYLLDGANAGKIHQLLNAKNLRGICGFQIKVNSLQAFNKSVQQIRNADYENGSTTIYFKAYSFFLTFTE